MAVYLRFCSIPCIGLVRFFSPSLSRLVGGIVTTQQCFKKRKTPTGLITAAGVVRRACRSSLYVRNVGHTLVIGFGRRFS